MSDDKHRHYLRDLGFLVREQALAAREAAIRAQGGESHDFELGQAMAWYSVVSLMQEQAVAFQIPFGDLALDGLDPYRDLLPRRSP